MKKMAFDKVHKEVKKPVLTRLKEIAKKYLLVSGLALSLTLGTGEVKADTAKKPEVKVAQAQEQKAVKVPKKEVLDAIETAKKYEIEIPDMTCPEHSIDVVNKRVTDDGYRVFYSKYGQDFTLYIDDGGGFAVYNGIRELKGSISNLPHTDTWGGSFWLCTSINQKDETPGYQRVRAFEVPYKKIVNGQEEQRSLIVIADYAGVDIIARDDSDGKWKRVGIINEADEVIANYKTDKPTIGISLEKDEKTGEDIVTVAVIRDDMTRGFMMSFATTSGGRSKSTPFDVE